MAAEAAWISAIIALMAFVAAAVAVAVTLNIYSAQQHTLELQRKQFEEQQRQARREQAAKISFFVDVNNDQQFQLKVINASDYGAGMKLTIRLTVGSYSSSRRGTRAG
jgi:type II secretory pathway pseudopilin PulG